MVDFLLGHGADMLAKDEEQNSPLHVAVENKQTLVVQMLLEAGNPTNLENNVSNPLFDLPMTDFNLYYVCIVNILL